MNKAELPIVDVRCRVTIPEAGDYFSSRARSRGRFDAIASFKEGTPEAFFRELDAFGIKTAVSPSGQTPEIAIGGRVIAARTTPNDLMARLQNENPGRFIGVAGIDLGGVLHDAMAELARCHDMGLRAVFVEPGRSPGCHIDDRALYPFYEEVQSYGMVLMPQTSGPWAGKKLDYGHPGHIDTLAEDFPDMKILPGHGCYPFVREAIIVAARHSNVHLAPDMYIVQMGTEDWVKSLNDNLFELRHQFLFGSSFPSIPLGPFMTRFFDLGLRAEMYPDILFGNALKLFGVADEPAFKAIYAPYLKG